jgi:hypothetical protein
MAACHRAGVPSGLPVTLRPVTRANVRAAGWNALETSFLPVEGGAGGFWRRCGFEDTGRTLHGEPVFRRALRGPAQPPASTTS